jgi:very-short-patch-repair endonuclease
MKKTSQQMIETINCILQEYEQKTRVVEWRSTYIVLENGSRLEHNERLKFTRRILNKKTNLWVKNIDSILSGDITDHEIKSKLTSNGGFAVQKQHGDKIKQNLNTGSPWNKGLTNLPGKPLSDTSKLKISIANSGIKNGMFGIKMSDEKKKEKSEIMKKMILTGEFTPNSNNRNTHWTSEFDGKKYRSSWEALYQYINPIAKYETLRIEYELNDNIQIYIVDFIDEVNRLLVEVKPKQLCSGDKFEAKMKALTIWANENSYTILMVDEDWIQSQSIYIDYSRFDLQTSQKIRKLYEIDKKNRD